MYTQCPTCGTVYELDATTLAQAGGEVGCGECGATFDALANLSEALPDGGATQLSHHPRSPIPPMLMRPLTQDAPAQQTLFAGPPADAVSASADADADARVDNDGASPADDADVDTDVMASDANEADDALDEDDNPAAVTDAGAAAEIADTATLDGEVEDAPIVYEDHAATPEDDDEFAATASHEDDLLADVTDDDLEPSPTTASDTVSTTDEDEAEAPAPIPSFVRARPAPRTRHHRGPLAAVCVALALILAVQVVWAERVPLTANNSTRPYLAKVCSWLGCTLPPVKDLADLQLLSRDVRPHPSVPGALLISATLRNNAPFTQPYPVISITLSDLNQNRIAMRRFRPDEYIPDPTVRAAGLAPGATAALTFEVKDPGRNAVAFRFGFQ